MRKERAGSTGSSLGINVSARTTTMGSQTTTQQSPSRGFILR